jgi:histidine triad (HIT) family protein
MQMSVLVTLARSAIGRFLIGWVFAQMNFAIPVNRLRETETMLAFYHPRPSYAIHVLLVPKKAIRSLVDLSPGDDVFLADVFRITQELVKELDLEASGYRLVVNGGEFQDVPQLHFHLISGKRIS